MGILALMTALVFGLILFTGGMANAEETNVIVVAQDGSGNYTTIGDALENAGEKDRIEVRAGTYEENVVVDVRVTIEGAGNGTTFIKGNGTGDVVSIEAHRVEFLGFSVSGSGDDQAGIAIRADLVTVRNTTCTNNTIGILVNDTRSTVEQNNCSGNSGIGIKVQKPTDNWRTTLFRNTCDRNKNYGIYILQTANVTMTRNQCMNNVYGIYARESTRSYISHNVLDENSDKGIFISGGWGGSIISNTCLNGLDGIHLSHTTTNTIWMNHCSDNQKGIHLTNADINHLVANECQRNGDGIFLETSEKITVYENTCSDNSMSGIHLAEDASSNSITFNTIRNNTERGIYLRSSSSNNVMENNTIAGNTIGIRVVQYSENNTACCNNIFGNHEFGMFVGGEGETVNATHSWWGASSGPYHATLNPDGIGNNVSDHVTFSPWSWILVNDPPFAVIELPPHGDPTNTSPPIVNEGDEIVFEGKGEDTGTIVRYRWLSSRDGEIYNGTDPTFTTSTLSPGLHNISFSVQDDGGAWSEPDWINLIVEEKEEDAFFLTSPAGIIVVLLLLLIVGGGFYFFLLAPEGVAGSMDGQVESENAGAGMEPNAEKTTDSDQKDPKP